MASERSTASTGPLTRVIIGARTALIVMTGALAVIWLVQLANWTGDYQLVRDYGIHPRQVGELGDVFSAPLLHGTWEHVESNSFPLFVFGVLAAYRGMRRFLALTLLTVLTSGGAVWLLEDAGTVTVGASGVVYGYFGYVVLRGIFDRNLLDTAIGVLLGASYAYILLAVVPGDPGISWLGHLGGLLGGLAGAWVFRDRRAKAGPATAAPVPGQTRSTRADLLKELDDLGI
ncbi:rhomboid family intramembrane serine protease [Kitasatospora sp. NPDC057223]|uniref:rhomboid family intramembrane serine protease n=1 Tax=Kitasatospora sp. NPDC057223 TaxID=3346055 RepID=UPI00363E10DD